MYKTFIKHKKDYTFLRTDDITRSSKYSPLTASLCSGFFEIVQYF